MKVCTTLVFLGALGAAVLVGCGGNETGPPLSLTEVRDTIFYIEPSTGAQASLPSVDISTDPESSVGTGTPPDRSCTGVSRRPAETGADIDVVMTVQDFQMDNTVDDVVVQFYRDNALPPPLDGAFSCTDPLFPCQMATTNTDGVVSAFVDADASWYSYFIRGRTGPTAERTPVDTAQYNEVASTVVRANSVSRATLALLPTVLNIARQTGTAIVAGTIYDCADAPVRGLVVRLFQEDGDDTTTSGDTLILDGGTLTSVGYRYFNGDGFPNGDQPFSNVDGLYAAANIPVGASVRVEAWHQSTTGPELWGCERIRVFPDGVTIVNVRPMRADITGCTPPL